MGLAAALLVFTGIWQVTECFMDRGSRDAKQLVPVGLLFLVLGVLIAMGFGGLIIQIAALLLALAGAAYIFTKRARSDVRRWVVWALIIVDVLIVIVIVRHWI